MLRLVGSLALCSCDSLLGLQHLGPAGPPDAGVLPDSFDDGLVAWYSLEDASFTDRSGHGHTGTCTPPGCPTIVPGHLGNGVRFDGVDDRIDVAGTDDLSTIAGFTVAAWVNVDTPGTIGTLASKIFGTACANSWQLHVKTGEFEFFTTTDALMAPGTVNASHWQHVAARYTGTEKTLIVGGVEKAIDLSATSFDLGKIIIGADEDFGQLRTPFTGEIDELRIYNRVLSNAELETLAAQ